MSKELRVQLDDEVFALIEAVSKARRVKPARIVTEAILASLEFLPRLERAVDAAEKAYGDKQVLAILADQIEDGFAAMADNEALREENTALNAAALYSLSDAHE